MQNKRIADNIHAFSCLLTNWNKEPDEERIYRIYIYLSGFDKRYLQNFLATVSFEACSVLDHSFFFFK